MKEHNILKELFDEYRALPLAWDGYGREQHAVFHDRQGTELTISFVPITSEDSDLPGIDIEFNRAGRYGVTGSGDAELIFATVVSAIKTYLQKYDKPRLIIFSAKELSRSKLYQRMIKRFAEPFGYKQVPFSQLPEEITSIPGYGPNVFALMRA